MGEFSIKNKIKGTKLPILNKKKLNYLVNTLYHYKLLQACAPSSRPASSTSRLKIFVTTWNCGDLELGPLNYEPWLQGCKDCDIVAIGMQEASLDIAFKMISQYFQDSNFIEVEKIRMLYVYSY